MKVSLKLRWLLVVVSLISLSSFESARAAAGLEYVTIYKAKPGRASMYTQFTRLKDGTLLCAFVDSERDKGEYGKKGSPWTVPGRRIMCVRSADNGRTWSDTPTFIFQDKDNWAYVSEGGRGYQAKDGTIIVPFGVWDPIGNAEAHANPLKRTWDFIARSKDNGWTWECEQLSSAPFFWSNCYGGITRLDDGSLWIVERCGGYQIDLAKAKEMAEKGQKATTKCRRILQSKDEGKTWSHYAYVGYDPTRPEETAHFPVPGGGAQQEPAVVQFPSGKILMITRPFLKKGVSLDRGKTWEIGPSTLTRKGTSGLCPSIWYTKAGPPTGTTVLAYHDRWGEHAKKGGVYISFSHDEGETFGYPIFVNGGAYPALYELEDGSGKFLCGHYRSSTLIQGIFFSVPFPTGLRASASTKDSGLPYITVEWDSYEGKGCEDYEYRLYRSTKPEVPLTPLALVFSGRGIYSYCDEAVEYEQQYYYRVAAFRDGKVAGRSWCASVKIKRMISSDLPYIGLFNFGKHDGHIQVPTDYDPARQYPFIICFYGRGANASRNNFLSPEFTKFRKKVAERGYIVAVPDYGSNSWMNARAETISLEMVEFLKKHLSIDPKRFCVLGSSMGGGAALIFSMRNKQIVAATCSIFGMSDIARFYDESNSAKRKHIAKAYGGTPTEKSEAYRQRSAIGHIDDLKDIPLLLIHGDKDRFIRTSHSETLYEKLKTAGAKAELVIVPGIGHSNAIIQGLEDKILDHFDSAMRK